jgi:hypothetical protein
VIDGQPGATDCAGQQRCEQPNWNQIQGTTTIISKRTSTLICINYFAASYIVLPAAFGKGGYVLGSISIR